VHVQEVEPVQVPDPIDGFCMSRRPSSAQVIVRPPCERHEVGKLIVSVPEEVVVLE